MSNSVIYVLLFSVSLWASDPKKNSGCEIPDKSSQKGKISEGCSPQIKTEITLFPESQIRCKVVDVKCDPENKGDYLAVARVEQWLKGSGPQKVQFKFSLRKKGKPRFSEPGRGLCADLTLEKQNSYWVLTKIDNPTSSPDSLPVCP